MSKLTDKQEKFIQELLKGKSQRQAYKNAGYKCDDWKDDSIDVAAYKLLKNTKVSHRYNELKKQVLERAIEDGAVTKKDIISELSKIGFANATDFIKVENIEIPSEDKIISIPTVKIENTDDVPESKRAAIASIKSGAHGIEIKLHDKVKALSELKDIFNLTKEDQEEETEDDGFIEAMKSEVDNIWADD